MMYTLNIDNGVEVELEHDLRHMPHGLILCFEFRTLQKSVPYSFLLPNHNDELVQFLFDISMTHTIDHAFRHTQVCNGQTYLSAYEFHIVTSTDHQTNITPEFLNSLHIWSR